MELRPFQKQALEALSTPGHVLCIAPTGAGKSLIFERAARVPDRRTLLVTPLVALARQQRERLAAPGDLAAHLGAGYPSEGPPPGGNGIWIVSPEKLLHPSRLHALRSWKPDLLVVDECHCLWEWGEGFRPAFLKLPELLADPGVRTSLWLTATLPLEARQELRALLPEPRRELGEFDLPRGLELSLARVPWVERVEALVGWLRQQKGAGIVFVPTRQSTLRIASLLQAAGIGAASYHAGMSAEERRAIESRVAARATQAVVATSAFGMGMNYPHLEWVVLWQAPATLLSLAQAVGRAGRSPSARARALALWDDEDFRLQEWTIRGSARRARQLELTSRFFRSQRCRRAALRSYFELGRIEGEEAGGEACGACDACRAGAGTEAGLRGGSG